MNVSRSASRLAVCLLLAAAMALLLIPGLAGARPRDKETQAGLGLGSVSKNARTWLDDYYLPLPALDTPYEVYADAEMQQRAQQVFDLVNAERAREGLAPLRRNPHLDAVAQAHAVHMYKEDFFEHESPLGMEVFERIDAAGAPHWSWAGENIAAGYRTPQIAVREWMDSKGHRQNIERRDYQETGIGVAYAPGTEYGWYWVQVFATFDSRRSRDEVAASGWLDPHGPSQTLAAAEATATPQ